MFLFFPPLHFSLLVGCLRRSLSFSSPLVGRRHPISGRNRANYVNLLLANLLMNLGASWAG